MSLGIRRQITADPKKRVGEDVILGSLGGCDSPEFQKITLYFSPKVFWGWQCFFQDLFLGLL